MNNKGQSSEVFRLLIGGVIGLAIFLIIYSLIAQVKSQEEYLFDTLFYEKIGTAIRNPIGTDFNIEDVKVKKNTTLSRAGLSYNTGLAKECFQFGEIPENTGIEVSDEYIRFKNDLKLDFVINCSSSSEQACKGPTLCVINIR